MNASHKMPDKDPHAVAAKPMPRALIFAMATGAGLSVANIYYNQPMLGEIEANFGTRIGGLVPMITQLGYALGLFCLVPLGDIVDRKKLILTQFGLLALASGLAGWSPNGWVLVAASLLIGITACAAQQIVPFAAHLAPPEKRGAVVGNVMAGLLSGILLSRTLAGFVTSHAGWREMFLLGVPLVLFAAAWLAFALPSGRPEQPGKQPAASRMSYGQLMLSLLHLWRELPELRRAALTVSCLFASFSIFWTVLALRLQQPPFELGPDVAGLFGVVGAVGVAAAPLAGRIADAKGPRRVILLGSLLALLAWAILGLWPAIAGMVVGVVLLDFAMQAVLVSNQHIIFALRADARARINTLFMSSMFLGGAAGSALAMLAWQMSGWAAVAGLGVALSLVGLGFQVFAKKHPA